jgi:UDP-glucose 6-dehydrogenase
MKITVAGTGYVGLSIAVLLSQRHEVKAVDIIPEKVEMINNGVSPIQDAEIERYLKEKTLNLTATLDAEAAYKEAKIIIECKLIAASTVSKDEFYTEEAKTFLQEGFDDAKDWHKLVYGEITNIYIRK